MITVRAEVCHESHSVYLRSFQKVPLFALHVAPSLAMFGKLKDHMLKFKTKTELADWAKGDVNPVINSLQEADFQTFRALYSERLKELPA